MHLQALHHQAQPPLLLAGHSSLAGQLSTRSIQLSISLTAAATAAQQAQEESGSVHACSLRGSGAVCSSVWQCGAAITGSVRPQQEGITA
jgi:hypothetical protein